jgi:pimeloyl-ACP methyl ester carboxylesterase
LPGAARGGGNPGQTTPDLVNWVIQRGGTSFGWLEPQRSQTSSRSLSFGFNVRGDLYYPADTPEGARLPTVIWLHGYSYPLGYMWVYHNDLHPILALVRAGYAVLAFDQSGFGSRMSESGPFYDRYPHWSQMGRMVEDARAGIDALQKDSLVIHSGSIYSAIRWAAPSAFIRQRSIRASKAWSPSADSRPCAATLPTVEPAEWRATVTNTR